jgi:hypothetical protein
VRPWLESGTIFARLAFPAAILRLAPFFIASYPFLDEFPTVLLSASPLLLPAYQHERHDHHHQDSYR